MTIAISIRVGEGLVYAADSTSTLFENINNVSRLAQSFHHAKKLMQLGEYPIGIMTYGLGLIGTRNLESLVAEYENSITPFAASAGHTVQGIAEGLRDFLKTKYDHALPPPVPPDPPPQPAAGNEVVPAAPAEAAPEAGEAPPQDESAAAPVVDSRHQMGVVVGGYSAGQFYPDEFLVSFPAGSVDRVRPGQDAGFGILWWGVTAPIFRLYFGVEPEVIGWMTEKGVELTVAQGLYEELRQRFGWTILFDGMPLQDAIDLGVYLANVTIGHSRFVVGPPVCGGHVDVATITHRGFAWVRQKRNVVKSDSIFF